MKEGMNGCQRDLQDGKIELPRVDGEPEGDRLADRALDIVGLEREADGVLPGCRFAIRRLDAA
jgi:hypothetical protein